MAKLGRAKLRVSTLKTLKKQPKTLRKRLIQHHPVAGAAAICSLFPPGLRTGARIRLEDSLNGDLCKFADMTILVDDIRALLDNSITRFFRRLNVWEYKGPNVSVGWKALRQALGYVHQKCLALEEETGESIVCLRKEITSVYFAKTQETVSDRLNRIAPCQPKDSRPDQSTSWSCTATDRLQCQCGGYPEESALLKVCKGFL